jgi:TPP-dependent pyruvate/acetoin dehydrogenase alpha subunit
LETEALPLAEITRVEAEVAAAIDAAVQFAMKSPYPAPEEALDDVYA